MVNNEVMEIHIDAKTKQLAEQAAVVLGYATLSEFFTHLIQNHAPKIYTNIPIFS
jgi:hypothetical protein